VSRPPLALVVSQVLSSGIRVGFVTGPPDFINRLNLHSQSTNMHVSGLSQAMVLALLRHWGRSAPQLRPAVHLFACCSPCASWRLPESMHAVCLLIDV
jgi:DNA-binding transcriptional MocR family regulator